MSETDGVQIIRLLHPTDEEKDRCQEVLFEGFKSNNLSHRISSPQHPLPLSDHRRNVYHRHKIDCASIDCEIWVVKVAPEGEGEGQAEEEGGGEGEIVCVGLVVPPGKELFDTEEKAVIHEAALDELDPSAKAWFENEFIPHAAKETDLLPYGNDKRYHVQALSTHPSFSHRGLARRLLKAVEERARGQGCRVGLNTTTAELAGFYERCGFRRVYSTVLDWQLDGLDTFDFYILVNDCGLQGEGP
ncbi:hypothetical protein I350_05053 [Cryptococcus amylolentus CBS 6273]|uniref:N-acetyltransferase domain-containing protein n=1 Tax=Cryptococcus amylolentus CBS 6273 TaxID=1296118 RepID=A0A1E3K1C3_9TREE|nr:hypothetical protein I350_05053 [Cryptococcus amylolentus CBS 6273]